MPQMRWHHLSVHYGPLVGPLGASYREIARSAQLAGGCRADQAARHAREDLPTYFGATGLPRGGTKAGRELRSKREARSARSPSVATMPKQVCGRWRLATSLIDRPNGRCRMHGGASYTPDGLARSRKANLKHGRYSAEAIAIRREAAAARRLLRRIVAALGSGTLHHPRCACCSGWPGAGLAIERDAVVSHEVCLSSDHIDDEERPRQHRKANMKRKNNLLRMKAHSSPQPLVCPTFRQSEEAILRALRRPDTLCCRH